MDWSRLRTPAPPGLWLLPPLLFFASFFSGVFFGDSFSGSSPFSLLAETEDQEVKDYLDESGADVMDMSLKEIEEASEVFSLPDGRYLVVEV